MSPIASALLLACPVCFGDASSPMVHGARMGVLFLLVVIVGVLAAIGLVARSWARRARELEAAELAAATPALRAAPVASTAPARAQAGLAAGAA